MNIPKKLYYVWVGDKEKPEIFYQCYKSWKEKMVDYEIIEINEKNFDIEYHLKKNKFFRECYKRKIWAYVSDYIRINYLYDNGGIYLDTDMEILKDFTPILEKYRNLDFLSFFESEDTVGISIYVAKKKSKILKKLIEFYDKKIWELPIFTLPSIVGWVLENNFKYNLTKKQIIDKEESIYILNKEYFYPSLSMGKWDLSMSEGQNYGIHWFFHSWKGKKNSLFLKTKHLKGFKKYVKKLGIYFQIFIDFIRNKKY